MEDGLAIQAEAAGAVRHQALALGTADLLAEVGLLGQAELAVAAFGRVKRDDVIALLQRGHARAHVHHDAGTFMPEDGREDAFGIGAGQGVVVGVADARGLDLDQDLAEPGAVQVDRLDGEGGIGGPRHSGFCFHIKLLSNFKGASKGHQRRHGPVFNVASATMSSHVDLSQLAMATFCSKSEYLAFSP